ncbi:hypothetical protein RDI58_013568 [Solanum bulbocastanum]|uniref:MBD domain-containing protein n=1 Tax=Solanum bulbocastanum TaxID=147425 RepID=A0AAN8TJS5_SOLBU
MDESFNYNEHFEKCFSPAVSNVSPHPILEFYRESWREKKSGIKNVDLIDDAQSKLQSVGQNSQMEKESDIITNVKGFEPKLQSSFELLDKVLAATVILGGKGYDPKLQGSVELVDKVLPTMILGVEGSESMLLASAELIDKSLALTSISELEGSEPKLQGSVELVDKVLPSLIQGDEGFVPKLQGSLEHVKEVLTPIMIQGAEEFDSKLLGYVEPLHKALAQPQIICSKEKSPFDIDQESGQPSNAKNEVKEKRKRKKRQSNNAKDDVKEKRQRRKKQSSNVKDDVKEKRKRKKKQSSNVDDDSWLPAGWLKIVRYRKTGILAGYSYNVYKDLGAKKIFPSKKQAIRYIEEQKLFEADRDKEYKEDTEQDV